MAGAFLFGWPSIIAVILNYVKRGDARGTWVASHYRWQIRTFWFALLWAIIGWALIFTLVGAVIGVPVLIALTLWLIYRIARGWLRLRDHKPMVGVRRGPTFLGVLTPAGVHRALRESLR